MTSIWPMRLAVLLLVIIASAGVAATRPADSITSDRDTAEQASLPIVQQPAR